MDRRIFLALLLSAAVILLTPLIFPSAKRPVPRTAADSAAVLARNGASAAAVASGTSTGTSRAAAPSTGSSTAAAPPLPPAAGATAAPVARVAAETTTVAAGQSSYRFVSPGAAPTGVELQGFASLRPGDERRPVIIGAPGQQLFHYNLLIGQSVVALDTVPMTSEATTVNGAPVVHFTGTIAGVGGQSRVTISYSFAPDSFLTHVRGAIEPAPAGGASLLVQLPSTLRSEEADTLDDVRQLAYAFKPIKDDAQNVAFTKLEPGSARTDTLPMKWVAVRNKYFFTGLIADGPTPAFSTLRMEGAPRVEKLAPAAHAAATLPLANGSFGFTLVAAPQQFKLLQALDHDLVNVHQYAGIAHSLVQPFATIVMRVLLWLKATTHLSYGWVLVIFGVVVRLILWPLNQNAMRNSIKMQRLQPELQAVQAKYKGDPAKQQQALVKLYQDHGMSPFSPMLGCLPMLLPMPILYALYFVFQSTIELRGVPFLWLPDLALHDPYYIMPILMGASMFVLSWIGSRAAPQTSQTKMMTYIFPAVFTFLFLRFASGLNLYYFVQNLTTIPQQWLLARERARAGVTPLVQGQPARR